MSCQIVLFITFIIKKNVVFIVKHINISTDFDYLIDDIFVFIVNNN
jgi:hypothetical protein